MHYKEKIEHGLGCKISSAGPPIVEKPDLILYPLKTDIGRILLQWIPSESLKVLEHCMESYRMMQSTYTFKPLAPLYWGTCPPGSFAVYEHIPLKPLDSLTQFGKTLAAMHRTKTPWLFGFDRDIDFQNVIIKRGWKNSWVEFINHLLDSIFQDENWEKSPFLELKLKTRSLQPDILIDLVNMPFKPCLLHGNLKPEFCLSAPDEEIVLLSPKSLFGHSEMDLARLKMQTADSEFEAIMEGYLYNYDKPECSEQIHKFYQLLYLLYLSLSDQASYNRARELIDSLS
jgi:fructosamine-3-kinase